MKIALFYMFVQYKRLTFLNLVNNPVLPICILNRVTKEIVPIATQSNNYFQIYTSTFVYVENVHVSKTKYCLF